MKVAIGVDIGTTQTKAVVFDSKGTALITAYQRYPLYQEEEGMAEQAQDEIEKAVVQTIHQVVEQVPAGSKVEFVSFSAAMHSLIVLDETGHALTRMITWADNRPKRFAEELNGTATGKKIYEQTGVPLHPMAPLHKINWLRAEKPDVYQKGALFLGIKEYLLYRFFGTAYSDYSSASGTGFFDIHHLTWSEQVLALIGIDTAQLPQLVPSTFSLSGLKKEYVQAMGIPEDTPFIVGGADGPLSNLGVGAMGNGRAALTVGTSGALRYVVDRPYLHPNGETFCYVLDEEHWIVGGATSNGAGIFDWACHTFLQEIVKEAEKKGTSPYDAVLEEVARVSPGSNGLIFHPYLLGERAPLWDAEASGSFVGLRREHTESEMVRAVVEGVCLNLKTILNDVIENGDKITEIRATGGFADSQIFRQLMADVLGQTLVFPESNEASALGAVIIGWQSQGRFHSLEEGNQLIHVTEVTESKKRNQEIYQQIYPLFLVTQQHQAATYHQLAKLRDYLAESTQTNHE